METFEATNTQVLGINRASIEAHKRYEEEFQFGFPLLSDPEGKIAMIYGALRDDKTIQRTVYIVDEEGIIRYAKPGMHWDSKFLEVLTELSES